MSSFVLGDLVDIKGGGTPNRGEPSFWNGEVPWATVKDFKSTELSKTEDSITHQGVANSATNIIPAGTIVVPTRMAVGKAAVTSVDMAINQDLKALIIRDNSQVDQRYLLRFLLGKAQMLEGMANQQRRALFEMCENLLLYAPACRREDFIHAIGYLVRRLDENTGPDNFLSHAFKLEVGGEDWNRLEKALSILTMRSKRFPAILVGRRIAPSAANP